MIAINPNYPGLLKEVRRQLALSQEDLARELGVSYATVTDGKTDNPGRPNWPGLNWMPFALG